MTTDQGQTVAVGSSDSSAGSLARERIAKARAAKAAVAAEKLQQTLL